MYIFVPEQNLSANGIAGGKITDVVISYNRIWILHPLFKLFHKLDWLTGQSNNCASVEPQKNDLILRF